jgi:protein-L-isoaspartate O-methyltransferase
MKRDGKKRSPPHEEFDQIILTAFANHPEKVAIWKKTMGIGSDDESE